MTRSIRFAAALLATLAAPAALSQNLAWSRSLYAPGGGAMTLSDGRLVTRTMAADGAGHVILAGRGAMAGGGLSALTTKLDAATGATLWQQNFGATNAVATGVALDAAGNAYVVGYTSVNPNNVDLAVVKYAAADGAMLWQRTFDAGTSDYAYAVAVDPSGNVVVGAEVLNAAGNTDILVLEYAAADGALTWQQAIDGGRDDFITDLAVDAAGNVLVAGVSMNAAGNPDMRVAKLAGSNGAIAWSRAVDNGAADEAFAIAVDGAGNAYVAGYFTISGVPTAATMKLAGADGAIAWEQALGSGTAQSIAVDATGNVVVTAKVAGPGGHDYRTVKYASTGATLWDKTYDSGGDDFAYQVALDATGNATVVGTSATGGNYDWRAIQYAAADGSVNWMRHYNGTGDGTDENYGVAIANAAVYLGGTSTEQGKPTGLRVMKLVPSTTMAATTRKSDTDFDGDLRGDLAWTNTDGAVRLWLMNGTTVVDSATVLGAASGWSIAGMGDLDGDGKADIVWNGPNGAVGVWLMDGLAIRKAAQIYDGGGGWSVAGVADFNGDGKADLLFTNTNGALGMWLMDGLATLKAAQFLDPGSGWKLATWGDLDGDGKADILLAGAQGEVFAWYMNGTQVANTVNLLAGTTGWSAVAMGDLDGDGKADIVWLHTSGASGLWLMDGSTVKSTAMLLSSGSWVPTKVVDLDGDGHGDLLWSYPDGSIGAWLMNGTTTLSATLLLGPGNTWKVK